MAKNNNGVFAVFTLLSSVANTESNYRFSINGNYRVFYRIYGKKIFIKTENRS